ncbi:NAD(P)(+) transhydrogenase (Re/Si-specific) subunit beta [Aliikangiella marina]|uniref:NAD(P)(+) transhydrogenase (Re/Si-specific) subunit beta n=1 Tax=Aliikangiella marina TaxID=1712262 RepID=A0A545TIY6_9GAMM|nr:NAD(P)(+) transhydrogenase (Re/Si-specific) subunit beta [Aliikangiella marina]TQV77194.1 NAD(P)(+) transhydrogenase (Re/Si-specific) subunit beta [Aliikangiella marina]
MQFSSEIESSVLVAIVMVVLTAISKYFGYYQFGGTKLPIWSIFLIATFIALFGLGFVSFTGVAFLALMLIASLAINATGPKSMRIIAGILAGTLFLGLGFRILPGFENQILVDTQFVKGQSTTYTTYFNFDKTLGGLIFFLAVVPSSNRLRYRTLSRALMVTTATIIFVLGGGYAFNLIGINLTYLFDYRFLVLFLTLQIFQSVWLRKLFLEVLSNSDCITSSKKILCGTKPFP